MKTWNEIENYQPKVLKMFKNSFSKNRLAHAYLFTGMKGTYKLETAKLIAKSFFCLNKINEQPCEICVSCKRINSQNHPDLHIVEPDGLSIKKAQIQALQQEFSKMGVESNRKVYIINHADKMTTNAANSLLKFLEEPPSDTLAILLTTQVQQILPTILSRCQLISFATLSTKHFTEQLMEMGLSKQNAAILSQLTNNLEEAIALSKEEWFVKAQSIMLKLYLVINKNPLEAMTSLQDGFFSLLKEKEQQAIGLNLLLFILKDLLNIRYQREEQVVFVEQLSQLETMAYNHSAEEIVRKMSNILEAQKKLQSNVNVQLLMEQLVLNMQEGSSFV